MCENEGKEMIINIGIKILNDENFLIVSDCFRMIRYSVGNVKWIVGSK